MTDSDEELSAGRLGRTVGGRWLLERVLGVGGMASVYAARDPSGAVAAIKILHPEMSVRREVRDRFLREGYVANRIGHPGVVQALEHGETGEEVFLAMELLAGETLRARVKRHGRLPVDEVLDYADQILDVLAVAHDKGVVHRDLKPDNLFVSPENRIKILDFGLARVLDGVPSEQRTRTGVALGTLAYMAPEQALGRRMEIDGRVDIFALGATMFRILSGRRVHEAESEAELLMAMASRPAPPVSSVVPGIPPSVAGVVDLALAFSRDARYPNARTMQGDVRALRQGQPGPYASVRLSSREEATRADMAPATSHRTQPLSATLGSHVPGTSNTMPMPAYSMGVVTRAPGYGQAVSAAPQVPSSGSPQAPASVRTAPLMAHPLGVPAAVAAIPPGQSSFATTMPSTQPPGVLPVLVTSGAAPPVKAVPARGSLAVVLLLGFVGLALAGGAAAYYFLSGSDADAAATGSSSSTPSATAPSAVVSPPGEPATAPAENADEGPGSASRKPSSKKQDPSSAPGASASAALSPSAAPSPSGAAPAPPAPSASAAAPPAPTPPPPAPPAPPSPSAAPPAPPAPAPASPGETPRPGKRGKGRGR